MDIRCICPPKADGTPRHDHDTITLKDRMDFRSSIAIRNALALEAGEGGDIDMADILAVVTERCIRYGITAWTLVDGHGKPIPVSQQAITDLILSDIELATTVADVADEMYREAVLLPLLKEGSTSSPGTPTTASTSPKTPSSTRRRTRSSRSSTTSIPTDGIETTSLSLVGESSLSPNSESAA